MRIFDPKDQFGNSLLSQAETQKSSVKLEKQMAVGGGVITLTSTDISDIENWELSNASVKVNGQMISFLPDTSRDTDGNLVITLGETFSEVVLVLKRTAFDGMKPITIEVKIQRLTAKTLATAGKDGYKASENIQEWQKLGEEAYESDPVKYRAAEITSWNTQFQIGPMVEDSFLSLQGFVTTNMFGSGSNVTVWKSDLPCLQHVDNSPFKSGPIEVFDAKMPNLVDGSWMFAACENLRTFNASLPSLTKAESMFTGCTGLTEWTVALPNTLTDAWGMFYGCSGLTKFTASMAELTNAECTSMFYDCKLNEKSVDNILDTLPTRSSKGFITLGIDDSLSDEVKARLEAKIQTTASDKNWEIAKSYN